LEQVPKNRQNFKEDEKKLLMGKGSILSKIKVKKNPQLRGFSKGYLIKSNSK